VGTIASTAFHAIHSCAAVQIAPRFFYTPHIDTLFLSPTCPKHSDSNPKQTMPSKANIYGHPIHPMLVAFPIVCFILAFIADVIYEAGAGSDYSQFAYILLIAGIATAIAAAITGLIEYSIITYVLYLNIYMLWRRSGLELFYCVWGLLP